MVGTWVEELRSRIFQKEVTVYDSYGYRDPADQDMWIVPMRVWVHDDRDTPLVEEALEGWAIGFFEKDMARDLQPDEKARLRACLAKFIADDKRNESVRFTFADDTTGTPFQFKERTTDSGVIAESIRVPDARPARLRAYLAAAASLGQLNGSVLVAERGKVLIDTAYGFANMELGVRNTPETRFRVASITKQFTAMAVMMRAEEGKLAIADPISKWVDSVPSTWRALTIHQLLRHTSGISDYEEWFDGYTTQAYSDYMSQAHAPARIVRDAMGRPLDHEPGTEFRYSHSAYIVLGYIIERASERVGCPTTSSSGGESTSRSG